jgi:hypothetical protein
VGGADVRHRARARSRPGRRRVSSTRPPRNGSRAAEAASADHDEPEATTATGRPGAASSFFGPPVSLVEAFSYLGAAFVLAAWATLIARISGQATDATRDWLLVVGAAIPAVIFFVIGITLHGRSPRLGRAAGVAFAVSVALIWLGVTLNVDIFSDGSVAAVAGAAAGPGRRPGVPLGPPLDPHRDRPARDAHGSGAGRLCCS